MPDVKELFNETFMRWVVDDWVVIHSFRRVAKAGLPMAREAVSTYAARLVQEYVGDPRNTGIYIGDPARREESLSMLSRSMAAADIENAQAAVDAASVIFAHSILDGAAFESCRISSIAAPMDWEREVRDRQVRLGGLKDSQYEELVRDAVGKFIHSLERESLLTKVDCLLARCQPSSGWSPMGGYAFSRDRIAAFDRLRHDIIHGAGPRVIPDLEADLDYLSRTTFFFVMLLNHRYKLKVDPMYAARRPPRNRTAGN